MLLIKYIFLHKFCVEYLIGTACNEDKAVSNLIRVIKTFDCKKSSNKSLYILLKATENGHLVRY